MDETITKTPEPIMGFYDRPLWKYIRDREMRLQSCSDCRTFRYPPGPGCPNCLSSECEWKPLSGEGTIVSWAVFHRQYLPAYPAPYNVIAVRLAEGPLLISNLECDAPLQGSWIGLRVHLTYVTMPDGAILPRFRLAEQTTSEQL
jgi:uncharacterized OB-fold protein